MIGIGVNIGLRTPLVGAPSLDLNFAGTSVLDPRITFTRPSGAGVINASRQFEWVGDNQPRFDFDPVTGAARGLLVEEQRTNLLTYSEDFSNAAWGRVDASITADAATAPDGTATADLLIESATTGSHFVTQGKSVTSGTAYTFSVFVKAGTRTAMQLIMTGIGTAGANVIAGFDLVAGAASAVTGGGTSDIKSRGNGWYRCSLTVTATASVSSLNQIRLATSASSASPASYAGDGSSGIYIWGAQLEAGSFATSYIPATTAAATRAADSAVINDLAAWFNASEGTLALEAQKLSAGTTEFPRIAQLSDGTNSNALNMLWSESLSRLYATANVGGVNQADIGNSGLTQTAIHKLAFAYAVNDFAISNDGLAAVTDASGAVPTVDRLFIGRDSLSAYFNGHIRRIAYYPTRLPNATLQALTA